MKVERFPRPFKRTNKEIQSFKSLVSHFDLCSEIFCLQSCMPFHDKCFITETVKTSPLSTIHQKVIHPFVESVSPSKVLVTATIRKRRGSEHQIVHRKLTNLIDIILCSDARLFSAQVEVWNRSKLLTGHMTFRTKWKFSLEQRNDVISTKFRRSFNIMCLLGYVIRKTSSTLSIGISV